MKLLARLFWGFSAFIATFNCGFSLWDHESWQKIALNVGFMLLALFGYAVQFVDDD